MLQYLRESRIFLASTGFILLIGAIEELRMLDKSSSLRATSSDISAFAQLSARSLEFGEVSMGFSIAKRAG